MGMIRAKVGPLFLAVALGLIPDTPGAGVTVDPSEPLGSSEAQPRTIDPGIELREPLDLDLGWNDHIDVRCALSPQQRGDMKIDYVCEKSLAPSQPQSVVIPEATLIRDGKPHTYRIDMGLEQWWRGNLKKLQIFPRNGLESIRIGDGEGTLYEVPTTPEDRVNAKTMDSKHFRIYWGDGLSRDFTEEQAHGSLRNLEESWQFLHKVMQLKKVFPLERSPGRYRKVMLSVASGGYASGGGCIGMDPSGLRIDPPTWVIPHELMHTFQEAQGGKMKGMWHESHADYSTERFLMFYPGYFPPENPGSPDIGHSVLNPGLMARSHFYLGNGSYYYLCWPIWLYLDENPDRMPGLGNQLSSRLWQEIRKKEDIFSCIKRLVPSVDLKSLIGNYARRNVTWDYANGAAMRANCAEAWKERRQVFAELLPRSDTPPGWWMVPREKAPQAGSYTQHELTLPSSMNREVTVELVGLPSAPGQDWRASIVAVKPDGSEAGHSPAFGPGVMKFRVPQEASRLVLVVAATPDAFTDWDADDKLHPWRSDPSRRKYHYAVRLAGTTPFLKNPAEVRTQQQINADREMIRHGNGGGLVSKGATVASTAYVGPEARVLDHAKVEGSARIEDQAVVKDAAVVKDRAIVSGHAMVFEDAVVCDDARVRDDARIAGRSRIGGRARVLHHAFTRDRTIVGDEALLDEFAQVWSSPEVNEGKVTQSDRIGGDAVLTADYGGFHTVTNGVQTGFVAWGTCSPELIASRTKPNHLLASYDFAKPHLQVIEDGTALTDAFLIGAVPWVEKDDTRSGFVTLDGKSQALLLDPTLFDLQRGGVSLWVKWEGGVAQQPILYLGNGNDFLSITPDNGRRQLALTARRNGQTQELRASVPLPAGQWVHLAVMMDGREASIFLNGKQVAKGAFTIKPEEIRAASPGLPFHCYLGRQANPAQAWFRGAIDNFHVWSDALSPEEIERDMHRDGNHDGQAFPTPTPLPSP